MTCPTLQETTAHSTMPRILNMIFYGLRVKICFSVTLSQEQTPYVEAEGPQFDATRAS